MFSVLIIDDTDGKVKALREFFERFDFIDANDIDVAESYNSAIRFLGDKMYDLVILDLFLPLQKGDTPSAEHGMSLFKCIRNDEDIFRPLYIVGFTKEIPTDTQRDEFKKNMWFLIESKENSNQWQEALGNLMGHMRNAKLGLQNTMCYDYDVAIITALQVPENDMLKQVITEQDKWRLLAVKHDLCTSYYSTTLQTSKHNNIKIVTCFSNQMGGEAISSLTTKVIYHFRPKYVFMTGIMAATKHENVNLGDIIVAQEVFNGASGKIKDGAKKQDAKIQLIPDFKHFNTDPSFLNIVNNLKNNKSLLHDIVDGFTSEGYKPDTELQIHTGPVASMPAVVVSTELVNSLVGHVRKLVGIEMESYGMFYAAENSVEPRPKLVATIKSVSDFADAQKNDSCQLYASYTSAALLKYILIHMLPY